MKKSFPTAFAVLLFGSIVLVLAGSEIFKFISNLIWLFSLPPLPKEDYPFGIFSAPGGGVLAIFIICIPLILYAVYRISGRRR